MTQPLPPYLRTKFPELAAHWDQVQTYFHPCHVTAHTTLLTEGTVATKLYLIVQGSLRMWHTTDQRDPPIFLRKSTGSVV